MRARLLVLLSLLSVLLLTLAAPAQAASATDKLAVATTWTQPTAPSQSAWNGARLDQAKWASYGFDWSTDYCSSSPDAPLGYDFHLPCWRHDFGYRNFKKLNAFPASKPRLDDSFYFDLKNVCGRYASAARPPCYALAWTYYQAVKAFGSVAVSSQQIAAIERQYAA
jgi:hypothetical protein